VAVEIAKTKTTDANIKLRRFMWISTGSLEDCMRC
jgi:hypothetical protein